MKRVDEDEKYNETKKPSKKDIPMAKIGGGMSFEVKLKSLKLFCSQNSKKCKVK